MSATIEILIVGPQGCGKTTLANWLRNHLTDLPVTAEKIVVRSANDADAPTETEWDARRGDWAVESEIPF